jgi:hypothetical protein
MLRMALFMFIYFLPQLIQGSVSVGRISDFLNDVRSLVMIFESAPDV